MLVRLSHKSKKFLVIFLSAAAAVLSHPAVIKGHPLPPLGFLAWFAYVPLFLLLNEGDIKSYFKQSFSFAFLFYLGSCYWLYTAMNTFGGLSPAISAIVLLILVLILSFYFSLIFVLSRFISFHLRISAFWVFPIVWAAVEWARNHWPVGGFPWAQAAYSQWKYLSIIQVSDLTGVYGVTAFLVWLNLFWVALISYLRRRESLGVFLPKLVFVVSLAGFISLYGLFSQKKVNQAMERSPKIKVALLQGNIPQEDKWLMENAENIIEIYQNLTRRAFLQGAEIAIWPESSYPYEIPLDIPERIGEVGEFQRDVIIGAVTYDSRGILMPEVRYTPMGYPIHNTGFLLNPAGNLIAAYHKQHLVPYGEYIPLKVLPFVGKLTAQIGEFQRGKGFTLLNSGDSRMGLLICYEDIFPEMARGHTRAGANLLVNLTNDGWYGDSSALPQHLSFSAFRTVENRRALVRATNTGITAVVDPAGRIQKQLPPFREDLLVDEVSLVSIPSFYVKWGDLFAYLCIGLSLTMLTYALFRKIRYVKRTA